MTEIFKPIGGYGNYLISNLGRIYSEWKSDFMTLNPDFYGYISVPLSSKGKGKVKRVKVHRLVAEAFILNPNQYDTVDHINRDKTDNRVENLRWLSHTENARLGNIVAVVQMDKDGNDIRTFDSIKDAESKLGIFNIQRVCKGERKSAGGFRWRYVAERGEWLPLR